MDNVKQTQESEILPPQLEQDSNVLFPDNLLLILLGGCAIVLIFVVMSLQALNMSNKINNARKACIDYGGKWLQEYSECDHGLSKPSCEQLGGIFEDCASFCRHDPPKAVQICVPACARVCKFN